MSTAERLQGYNLFTDELVGRVAEVADRQRQMDYDQFLVEYGIGSPITHTSHSGMPYSILDIKPIGDFDETKARVIYSPMANPLDPNNIYHAATIHAVDPTVRTVVAGNPSSNRYPGNKLTSTQRKQVASGDPSPTIEPVLDYLENTGVIYAEQIGYSWGVNKATAAAIRSETFDMLVPHLVQIEPADAVPRNIIQSARAFGASAEMLDYYVERSDVEALVAARENSIGDGIEFMSTLFGLSNLAITRSLGRGQYYPRTEAALRECDEMNMFVVWGDQSELASPSELLDQVNDLQAEFNSPSNKRVQAAVLDGETHAMGDDIHLKAALVHHGLSL